MCGAFTLHQYTQIVKELGLEAGKDFLNERFNIRPTNYVASVLNNAPKVVQLSHWGMTPAWGNRPFLLFNTREESLIEKPYFNRLFKTKRCLVLADGFYEWEKSGNERLPHRYVLKGERPFAFAGIWDESPDSREPQVSIITTNPNQLVGKVHDRMPAILPLDYAQDWIQNIPEDRLIKMLEPLSDKLMESYRVSKEVNSSKNDRPDLIKPYIKQAA